MSTVSNKRVAKNTVILYFRMLLTMGIALYTSRVVLEVLGASDYGLYNVVGGIVTMLAFLNSSMGAGTSRFMAYELGREDQERLSVVFNVALVSHILIALFVFIIAETVGLWFVNTQLVFPEDRQIAVNVVYQVSIVTTMLQFTQLPYNADIIAHEKMDVYAYVTIADVLLKLTMVLLLKNIETPDGLISYSLMVLAVQIITLSAYRIYCRRNYQEAKWKFVKDKAAYKEIFAFSGWDVIGALTVATQGQGINILLNIYFGPLINAARAIAYQVQGAFQQFTSSFMTAVNPELVKSFAKEEYDSMVKLLNDAALYSFFLLSVFVIPVMFKLKVVLDVWLVEYPKETLVFTEIVLALMIIRALAQPVIHATHATGDIKALNLYAGLLGLLPLPVAWIALKLGAPAVATFWIILLWGVFANIAEILIFKSKLREYFSIKRHFYYVYVRCLLLSIILCFVYYSFSILFDDSFLHFCFYYCICLIVSCLIIMFLGMPKLMRNKIIGLIKQKYALYKAK